MKEKTFTLDQTKEELVKEQEQSKIEIQERLTEFMRLLTEAEEKTNCTIKIDLNSKLGDLKLIAVPIVEQ